MWRRAWEAMLNVLIAVTLVAFSILIGAALWLRPGG